MENIFVIFFDFHKKVNDKMIGLRNAILKCDGKNMVLVFI